MISGFHDRHRRLPPGASADTCEGQEWYRVDHSRERLGVPRKRLGAHIDVGPLAMELRLLLAPAVRALRDENLTLRSAVKQLEARVGELEAREREREEAAERYVQLDRQLVTEMRDMGWEPSDDDQEERDPFEIAREALAGFTRRQRRRMMDEVT